MKHFVNSTLRWLLTAIGLSLAAVSAYLTAIFLSDYGDSTGYGGAFSIAGVLLDMAKTFLPVAAVIVYRYSSKIVGVSGLVLSCLMMFTSYSISVAALSQSASAKAAQATESQRYAVAIDSLKSQIATKEARIERLRAVDYHTSADALQVEVDHLSENLREMLTTTNKVKSSNDDFNLMSAKILSALIEITASVSLVMANSLGRPSTQLRPVPNVSVAEPFNDPLDDIEDIELPIAEIQPAKVQEMADDIIENVSPVKEAQPADAENPLLAKAKEVLAGGHARPSQRSLAEAMDIKRPDAEEILTELEAIGFLVKDGRFRVLA